MNMDRAKTIFGNDVPDWTYRKAIRNKRRFQRRYGDDSGARYRLSTELAPAIGKRLSVNNIVIGDQNPVKFNDKSVIIGNIRMGYGHYRISMAMASAAHAMGYEPFWFDLCSFEQTAAGKIIAGQNDLYSLGSRLSQQDPIFDRLVWEPLSAEGFRQLTYNCGDQKMTELMTPVFRQLPKHIPFVACHVWTSQAAIHAGLTHVVNAVPDNWPLALHLSEGAIHTVQTPSVYFGYRTLRGMAKKRILRPMPGTSIAYTGHYVDHELVSNIVQDCRKRRERVQFGEARRWLMSVGGAGAQKEIFLSIIRRLLPEIRAGRAVLFFNLGDHRNMWEAIEKEIPEMKKLVTEHFNAFRETERFCEAAYDGDVKGIHVFCDNDIFSAVYTTNLLMRVSDVLITKPSELSFYPIPKLMIHRVGGHEAWGAVRAAEIGDSTYECVTIEETTAMIRLIQKDPVIVNRMCDSICNAHEAGIYHGAYRAVKLAVKGKIG